MCSMIYLWDGLPPPQHQCEEGPAKNYLPGELKLEHLLGNSATYTLH